MDQAAFPEDAEEAPAAAGAAAGVDGAGVEGELEVDAAAAAEESPPPLVSFFAAAL
jgi:hypothetical protein